MTLRSICQTLLAGALAATSLGVGAQPPAGGRPVLLHVRLDITDSESNDMKTARFAASLLMSTPALMVQGKEGLSFAYEATPTVTRLDGWAMGQGRFQIVAPDGSIREQFDMQGEWAGPPPESQKGWLTVTMPRPAKLGEGMDLQIKAELPLAGHAEGTVQGGGRSERNTGRSSAPSICSVVSGTSGVCKFELHVAPLPTRARDPLAQPMLAQMQEAEANAQAAYGLAMMGFVNGLSTQNLPGGHVILRLKRQYVGHITRDIEVHVWSSARTDLGLPPGVPPIAPRPSAPKTP